MTPEERVEAILANVSAVGASSARRVAQGEMVLHQIREAIREAYEDAAKIAKSDPGSESPTCADRIAAAIRSCSTQGEG